MNRLRLSALSLILLLAAAAALAEGISSRVSGRVASGGKPLAGVTVTATSPTMLGTRSTVTGADGAYVLDSLPYGTYSVTFAKRGMTTLVRVATLELAQTSLTDAVLQPSDDEETVTSTARKESVLATPLIATTVDQKLIEQLPVNRDLDARVDLTPGVTRELTFGLPRIAGQGLTTFVDGGLGAIVPGVEDAADQVTVLSAALPAEYGFFSGGVIAVGTPSGGDSYSGSFRDTLSSERWSAADRFRTRRSGALDSALEATLGGKIVEGRLWFFTAGRAAGQTNSDGYPASGTFHDRDDRELAKLYGALTASQTVTATYSRDHERFADPTGDAQLTSSDGITAHYTGALGPRLVVEATGSGQRVTAGQYENRSGQNQSYVALEASYAFDSPAGLHDLSAGIEREHLTYQPLDFTESDGRAAFVRDRWTLGRRLTADAGFRYDEGAGLSHVSPRIGLVYDLRADGRARVTANYAEYFVTGGVRDSAGSLEVKETLLAYGFQIGSEGSGRVGWSHRSARAEYRILDVTSVPFRDSVDSLLVDAGYRLFGLVNVGGTYTFVRIPEHDQAFQFSRSDIHDFKLWLQGDLPLSVGHLNVSLLQRHRSAAVLDDLFSPDFPVTRGAVDSTDLAATYSLPVKLVTLSIKPELLNLFNRQGVGTQVLPMSSLRAVSYLQPSRTFRVTAAARF